MGLGRDAMLAEEGGDAPSRGARLCRKVSSYSYGFLSIFITLKR